MADAPPTLMLRVDRSLLKTLILSQSLSISVHDSVLLANRKKKYALRESHNLTSDSRIQTFEVLSESQSPDLDTRKEKKAKKVSPKKKVVTQPRPPAQAQIATPSAQYASASDAPLTKDSVGKKAKTSRKKQERWYSSSDDDKPLSKKLKTEEDNRTQRIPNPYSSFSYHTLQNIFSPLYTSYHSLYHQLMREKETMNINPLRKTVAKLQNQRDQLELMKLALDEKLGAI